MNYEQKYKETLERAKEWMAGKYGHYVSDTPQEIAEFIFPELKESEDERMRKSIIYALRNGGFYDNDKTDEAIAWLEKLSEQTDIANKEYWRGYRDGKQEILDKYAELEKQGEQKSIDAVEPRFHEGDFIKNNKANLICKVISVNSGSYCVKNIETSSGIELFNTEQNFHLWTIEDARDGDVLVSANNQPFIYNGKYTDSTIGAHIGISYDGKEVFIAEGYNWTANKDVKPATKEQCDLLFAKMKEAGYEWDANKKKLIKL